LIHFYKRLLNFFIDMIFFCRKYIIATLVLVYTEIIPAQPTNSSSLNEAHPTIDEFVSKSLSNGEKVIGEVIGGAKPIIDVFTDLSSKLMNTLVKSYTRVAAGFGPYDKEGSLISDQQLDEGLGKLQEKIEQESRDFYSKHPTWTIERDATSLQQGIRRGVIGAGNMKKFFGVAAEDVNSGLNDMILLLANETKDLDVKAKPIVDVIVKVDEVVKSPEAQAVIKGIGDFAQSVARFFETKCQWKWNYERPIALRASQYTVYYDIDTSYIWCLAKKRTNIYTARNLVLKRAYISEKYYGLLTQYLQNNFCCFKQY